MPLAAAFVCVIAALAQNQQRDEPKLGRVTGTVVETKSGEPVRKAVVLLRRDPNSAFGTLTGDSGKFSFGNLEPGAYTIAVEKDGWVSDRDSKALTTAVAAGVTSAAVTVHMVKTGTISGRVMDADGDPLAGVSVQVIPEPPARNTAPNPWGTTDDRGEYRAYNVAPGKYRVCATYSARSQRMDVQMQPPAAGAYPRVCSPGAEGAVYTVEPGMGLQGIDFQMIPARAVKVKGRVISHAAERPLLAMVMLQSVDGTGGAALPETLLRDADGKFELQGVLPGHYRLAVAGAGVGGEGQFSASKKIDVADTDVEGVEIVVGPPRRIQGTVVVPDGRKVPQLMIVLAPRDRTDHDGGGFAQVASDGAFHFPAVAAGEYDVALASTGPGDDLYVSAIRLGDSDALADGIRPDVPGDLRIVLKANGGALTCSVSGENDQPVPAAHVELIPDAPQERQLAVFGDCRTDANGTCEIQGIAPGEYHVYAFPSEMDTGARDAGAMKAFEAYGKALKVAEGEKRSVQLKAVPGN